MRFTVKQTGKTTLTASFDVICQGAPIGEARFESYVESGQGAWSAALYGSAFSLAYARPRALALGVDDEREYALVVDGAQVGTVKREAAVTAAGVKLTAVRASFGARNLEMRPFSLGRKGYRYPVFEGQRQIAEIAKECKVVDDLNDFEVAVVDSSDALPVFALCCYVFTQSWWRPGPARKHHTHRYIQRATKPGVDYYDEGFFNRV